MSPNSWNCWRLTPPGSSRYRSHTPNTYCASRTTIRSYMTMFLRLIALPFWIAARWKWLRHRKNGKHEPTPKPQQAAPTFEPKSWTEAMYGEYTKAKTRDMMRRLQEEREAENRLVQEQSRLRWEREERAAAMLHEQLPTNLAPEHRAEAIARAKGERHDTAA